MLLCFDPHRPLRYLEVSGMVVEMTGAGAAEYLYCLASKYAGRPIGFFGDAIPASFAQTGTPVLCRIGRPTSSQSTRRGGKEAQDRSHRARTASGTSLAPGPADPADLRCVHDTGS